MIDLLTAGAFATYWLVRLVRVLPGMRPLLIAGRKPWACDICLSSWCALFLGTVWSALSGFADITSILLSPAAAGGAILLIGLAPEPPLDYEEPK